MYKNRENINHLEDTRDQHQHAGHGDSCCAHHHHHSYDEHYGHEQHKAGQREKIGRNEPCPCGSGKKYKKCCLA